ncbi:MAG: DNA-processing protein DprA [Synechococcales cyanobacterium]
MGVSERTYWAAWLGIPGIGCHRLKRLASHFGQVSVAWQADVAALRQVEGIGEHLAITIDQERRQRDPERIVAELDRPGIPWITPADAEYPQLLWEIPDPPPLLYGRGTWSFGPRSIAMVGTRHPSDYGKRWGSRLAQALSEAGFTVVSGLAAGIDRVCHEGALQGGGATIAVVGTGVDVVYPAQHRALAERIENQGLILSEYPPRTPPAKENFPRRNRLIAGLCTATIVVEAPAKSGALITAYLANDYNRDVYVLPGSLDNPAAYGGLSLIQRGAEVILGVDELLTALGVSTAADQGQAEGQRDGSQDQLPTDWPADYRQIWQALDKGQGDPVSLDALALHAGLEIQVLSTALLMMELAGWVEQHPGMRYTQARSKGK